MILILLTVILVGLKYFEVSFMANVSWWWVACAFAITFIWFEFFERIFGLDKKKAHKEFDEIQKKRAKKVFEKRN